MENEGLDRVERPARWVFDGLPASGARTGGDVTSYVLDSDLDTLVRESIQNANDQRAGDLPVEVVFEFHRLTGESRDHMLEAMGWPQLRSHLEGVVSTDTLIRGDVQRALDGDDGPLSLLVIRDRNTKGLKGSEKGADGNFAPLCRHTLVTTEEKSKRGGSYGLGKTALWTFSGISTVFFASTLNEPEQSGRFRFIARAELPFHTADVEDTDEREWSGSGWLGEVEPAAGGKRLAVSLWDGAADEQLAGTPLGVDHESSGTSILIPFFREPKEDEQRDPRAVAGDVIQSINRWFWPSTLDGTLLASVAVYDNGLRQFHETASTSAADVEPFVLTMTGEPTGDRVEDVGDLATRELTVRTPPHRSKGEEQEGSGEIRLAVSSAGANTSDQLLNRIAFIRGAGMVVKYYSPRRLPLDDGGFYGVLQAGKAHGTEESDRLIEDFLIAAEPPAHNDWESGTNRLRTEYGHGAGARLKELHSAVDSAVREICSKANPETADGPDLLKKLFPLGTGKGPKTSKPRHSAALEGSEYHQGRWTTELTVERLGPENPWAVRASLGMDAESGSGGGLAVLSAESDGYPVEVGDSGVIEIKRIPASERKVRIRIEAEPVQTDTRIAARARLSADVRVTRAPGKAAS